MGCLKKFGVVSNYPIQKPHSLDLKNSLLHVCPHVLPCVYMYTWSLPDLNRYKKTVSQSCPLDPPKGSQSAVSQVSHAPSLATPPPPSVSVSWTQHRSLASPSPSQVVSFLPSSHWPQRYYYSATSGGRSYGRSYGRSFPKDRPPRAILWPVFCVNIKN